MKVDPDIDRRIKIEVNGYSTTVIGYVCDVDNNFICIKTDDHKIIDSFVNPLESLANFEIPKKYCIEKTIIKSWEYIGK